MTRLNVYNVMLSFFSAILQYHIQFREYNKTHDNQTRYPPKDLFSKEPSDISNDSAQNGNGNGARVNGNGNDSANGTGTTGSSTAAFSPTDLAHIHRVGDRIQTMSNNSQAGSVRDARAQARSGQAAQATTGSNAGTTAATTSTNGHSTTNRGTTNGNGSS